MPRKRGAVVIGVNKTGGLAKLEASVSGAQKFAKWLTDEGFVVTAITDEKEPVTTTQIKDAIKAFVVPGTYDQLIVYFTGHGYWKNDAELWLLTGAPEDANEAVNWKETVDFAKDCGIPNVVLISDACRSLPDSPQASRVRGSIVFPNDNTKRDRAKVDRFLAAAVGTSAYEVPLTVGGSKENVFTHCLLQAFKNPDRDMVVSIQEEGQTITIVPNRKLGPYLRREVADLLAKVDITIDQTPDDEVMSDETAYIGRATAVADIVVPEGADIPLASARRAASAAKRRKPIASTRDDLRDIAAKALVDAIDAPLGKTSDDGRDLSLEPTGHRKFDDAFCTAGNEASDIKHFETETGFAVIGVRVQEAVIMGGFVAGLLTKGDGAGEPALIRVDSPLSACTVVVEFENGSGAALAALRGYIGHVVVDQGNVVSINYVPSENSTRFAAFANRRAQFQRLRAAAAAAIRFGVFRIDDQVAARKLADLIKVEKSVDPSLGLYAAYAYSEGDSREKLASVASYMHDDLNADLFDVAMLARRPTSLTVPFCPMLTQGWNLLRARGIELPEVLEAAQDDLHRAVWTTFRADRMQKIFKAISNGELK